MVFNKIKHDIRARLGVYKMIGLIDTSCQPAINSSFSNYFSGFTSYLILLTAALNFTFTSSRCRHD